MAKLMDQGILFVKMNWRNKMSEEEKKAIEIVQGLKVYYDNECLLDEEELEENKTVNNAIIAKRRKIIKKIKIIIQKGLKKNQNKKKKIIKKISNILKNG